MKLKVGDKVRVMVGKDKGKEGKITKVLDDKVIVEGVNVCKKHLKPKNNNVDSLLNRLTIRRGTYGEKVI